jgi:hypothetical protein
MSTPGHTALALAARLQIASRRRESGIARLTTTHVAITLLIAGLVLVALFAPLRERIAVLLGLLDAHALPFALCVGAFAWTWARERHRRGEREHAHSWLAAAPIAARDVSAHLRRRAIVDFGVHCVAIFIAIALAAVMSACDARALLATSAIATIAGFASGWRSGRRALADAPTPLPRLRRRHATANANADLGALRRWPFAQWLADAQPRQHARVIAALLLSMPMGIPFSTALGIVLFAALALAAVGLLRATINAIGHAGDFMRTTPWSMRAFASNLVTHALIAETLFAAGAAALAIGGGAGIIASCLGAIAWIAICAAAATLALRHEQERGAKR